MATTFISATDAALIDTDERSSDRAYMRLAASIRELVGAGEFAAGQRLPSERALAERFNVSRTSVREAVIALEIQGVVEVRGGSGIYVTAQAASVATAPGFAQEAGPGPFELLRARCLIEPEVAALAATSRKDADLDRLLADLAVMRENIRDKIANEEADRRFHMHIAEATGNGVLRRTVEGLREQERGPLWSQIEHHFHSSELRGQSQDDHHRIFTAIVAGNASAARSAMRSHLERVINEFAQNWR